MNQETQKKALKIFFIVFIFLFVISLVLWKLVYNFTSPVNQIIAKQALQNQNKTNRFLNIEEREISDEELKTKDTDKDGLSDYQERYVYKTSLYLPDTDSDGKTDLEEIENGLDPNCPTGGNCYGGFLDSVGDLRASETSNTSASVVEKFANLSEEEMLRFFSGEAEIVEIKKVLIAQGANPEALEEISDENIFELYQELIQEFQKSLSE